METTCWNYRSRVCGEAGSTAFGPCRRLRCGDYFLDLNADDNCDYDDGNWAQEWVAEHPNSDLNWPTTCAHTQALNCNLKGRAFWWMMAWIAGWD